MAISLSSAKSMVSGPILPLVVRAKRVLLALSRSIVVRSIVPIVFLACHLAAMTKVGEERYSIPFFYEARADATIAPLPIDPPDRFAPFEYGDFLWKRITKFVEFRGMEEERRPRAG